MAFNSIDVSTGVFSILFLFSSFALFFCYERVLEARKIRIESQEKDDDQTVFLFENERMVDATTSARALLRSASKHQTDWQILVANLSPMFPELETKTRQLAQSGAFTISSSHQKYKALLRGELFNGITRLTFLSKSLDGDKSFVPFCNLAALEDELDSLRALQDICPTPCWIEDLEGNICWANTAYFALIKETQPNDALFKWPPSILFPQSEGESAMGSAVRTKISNHNEKVAQWFDVVRQPMEGRIYGFATPKDDIVDAESSLNAFRETLTNTFASLSVGLAVFDSAHKLVMFNPALIDLTSLRFEALSLQPTMYEFFDMLRELRISPKQKTCSDWRQHVPLLESVAKNGVYEETWSLPSGQVFRFTGHPQPDGAVALLLEDISKEISLSRTFYSELEINQAVLDQLNTAIVVFSPSGTITSSNAAYANLWGVDPNTSIISLTFQESFADWKTKSKASANWEQVETALYHNSPVSCEIHIAQNDLHTSYWVYSAPLTGGSYMIRFTKVKVPAVEPAEAMDENLALCQ